MTQQRHLISITDLNASEIEGILTLSHQVKQSPEKFKDALDGKKFGLIFEKPSTRTWVSFETGISAMGGSSIYLGPDDIKLGVREEIKDVARVLDRYLSGVVMRTFAHKTITDFEEYFTRPVVNGLSDVEHPCQALADYLTIKENFGSVKDAVVTWVGDGNNVLSSLILLSATVGGEIRYATPKKHEPDPAVLAKAKQLAVVSGAKIIGSHDPKEVCEGAHVIYGDVWVSMGEEDQREAKLKEFDGFQINKELVSVAHEDCRIMHCLPAHRGEEITEEVLESKNSVVFDQAENRLHAQKAALLFLCGF